MDQSDQLIRVSLGDFPRPNRILQPPLPQSSFAYSKPFWEPHPHVASASSGIVNAFRSRSSSGKIDEKVIRRMAMGNFLAGDNTKASKGTDSNGKCSRS